MAFELPDLPYAHDALAGRRHVGRRRFEYHHDLHHKAYVDNGNKLLDGLRAGRARALEEIVVATYQSGDESPRPACSTTRRSIGTTSQFWEMMGPGEKKMPGELEKALTESFGSVQKFKDDFAAAGAGQFGSGWCMARQGQGRRAEGYQDRERGEPALLRSDGASGLRRVGAFLLYRLPQQASRLPGTNFLDNLVNWENVASRM
jgi:Fe-Mn family superoxide dismutase